MDQQDLPAFNHTNLKKQLKAMDKAVWGNRKWLPTASVCCALITLFVIFLLFYDTRYRLFSQLGWIIVASVSVITTGVVCYYEMLRKPYIPAMEYQLDDATQDLYWGAVKAIEQLNLCAYKTSGQIPYAKELSISSNALPGVESNLAAFPVMWGEEHFFYFLPDMLIVKNFDSRTHTAIPYSAVRFGANYNQRYVRQELTPPDAQVLGQQWAYTTSNGQPDRRYKDNPWCSLVVFGQVIIETDLGFAKLLEFSRPDLVKAFEIAFRDLVVYGPGASAPVMPLPPQRAAINLEIPAAFDGGFANVSGHYTRGHFSRGRYVRGHYTRSHYRRR